MAGDCTFVVDNGIPTAVLTSNRVEVGSSLGEVLGHRELSAMTCTQNAVGRGSSTDVQPPASQAGRALPRS